MKLDTAIRGGILVTAEGLVEGDLGIAEGKIAEIGQVGPGAQEIVADGLHVFPGLIDTQVHFREPGMMHKEDLESGTRAAVAGGVTTIFEMPNTEPTTTTKAALHDKLARAEGRAWCDFAFFVGAATDNINQLAELEQEPGTPGVKIFMGSSTGSLLVPDDENLRGVLQNGRGPCPIHAEDHFRLNERKSLISEHPHPREHPFLRDAECARLASERILRLSEETGRPVHILHLSTADEIPLIRAAQERGVPVTVEITPQHLYFAAPDCYDELGTYVQMNPPMRSREHRDALRKALQEGFFEVIGSDHAPHTREEKDQPYPKSPSGMPGVQTILSVMLTLDLVDLPTLARLTSDAPARLYSLKNKGGMRIGHDADLAIYDLNRTFVVGQDRPIESKCGWSPYRELRGVPMRTLLRGETVYQEGRPIGRPSGQRARFLGKD